MSGYRNAGENNPFFGKRHTEETRQRMSEAAKRRWSGTAVPTSKPESRACYWKGKKHTPESRQKMRKAAKKRPSEKRGGNRGSKWQGGSPADCYRLLIVAVIRQAVKDGAVLFLESEIGRGWCEEVGINPARLTASMQERRSSGAA